ncbi:hypothetical protein MPTK1_4g14960 [Marchantia polymorpha subsp. ruderalis]|uniref:Uncharacterized protein n=2 Tax=Marchantia polymorpha TaxID=3197 RepID=A0AAF6BA14_MARPO|nr:hypothetical protein MARPO_0119s0019 [Marchantia polymorpha]BBN08846.1 hypothetical protein Mp_4g14960 [Marchantia polymorpha subsp. ruderalis]PTQ30812.1 hypothetical protein MARPO_0119s0019 [Marchantia polymorpha]PTQ30813.1 hypothetical protein MARPO_0119s0019 [Marchantia polymorpha]PTQ30814.1 hypothetical protein MARPO_0119s0019 [Marchantia polymorpha]|eukprot:PTQ30811.1 hypothetical protein MARPO_0119s0019 [Marchantia polymorpha]
MYCRDENPEVMESGGVSKIDDNSGIKLCSELIDLVNSKRAQQGSPSRRLPLVFLEER